MLKKIRATKINKEMEGRVMVTTGALLPLPKECETTAALEVFSMRRRGWLQLIQKPV
jgi:hypothetical protein